MSDKVLTPIGMLAFPFLFTPRPPMPGVAQGEDKKPRYECVLIWDQKAQKSEAFKKLQAAIEAARKEKWGDKGSGLKMPIKSGAERKGYGGFTDDAVFAQFWTYVKPQILGPRKDFVTNAQDVWAGQTARAYCKPFAYEMPMNKGVSLQLEHIQIERFQMPRLDGRKPAIDVFDELDVEEEDEGV